MNKYNIQECKTWNFSFVNLGAALATATCGGYIIITTGLLIAAATGELNGRKTVIISLFFHICLRNICNIRRKSSKCILWPVNSSFLDNYTSRHTSLIVLLFGVFKVFFLFRARPSTSWFYRALMFVFSSDQRPEWDLSNPFKNIFF